MQPDDLIFGQSQRFGEKGQIFAECCVIAGRHTPESPGTGRGGFLRHQRQQMRRQRFPIEPQRIIMHHQRAIGRHTFDETVERGRFERRCKRQDRASAIGSMRCRTRPRARIRRHRAGAGLS